MADSVLAGSPDVDNHFITGTQTIVQRSGDIDTGFKSQVTGVEDISSEKQYEHIHLMMKLTNDALAQMIVVVEKPEHQNIDINKSFNIENEINNYRNQLKNQNILDVNNKEYDYQMGVYYMDIIAECEKLGDYVVNVVEASSDVKEKKAS